MLGLVVPNAKPAFGTARPCNQDNVFKAIYTKNTPESKGGLERLLSAYIGRPVVVLTITANEPAVDNINERQIRFDINCEFANGGLCNIEMTMNPSIYEPLRMEYYSCKLFINQNIRGTNKSYNDLNHSYHISFLADKPVYDDDALVHHFQYYDGQNQITLGGRSHIITVELTKLGDAVRKPVDEMTAIERWGLFFKYATDIGKRELINEIIQHEEGIAMSAQVLTNISRDWEERMRLFSEHKNELDYQSRMTEAILVGRLEGQQEGRLEGRLEGILDTARNMLQHGLPAPIIAEITGLDAEAIRQLQMSEATDE